VTTLRLLGVVILSIYLGGCSHSTSDASTAATGEAATAEVVPVISSLDPATATAGSTSLSLTVNGRNFLPTSVVLWNGGALPTQYVSAGQLVAQIPATTLGDVGSAQITVSNSSSSKIVESSNSALLDIAASNPRPSISSIAPTSTPAGAASFTLTVNGSGFVAASVIRWNGASLTTTYVSAAELTAVVPAADLASAGSADISVKSPAPGGGTSANAVFSISKVNPVPSISSLTPTSATAGGPAYTLTVKGSNFIASSVVHWNGAAVSTTYASASKLTALVTAADIAAAGSASVTVSSPAPGGGSSSAATVTIEAVNPVPILSSMSPASTTAGAAGFTLTVNGTGFVSGSNVNWNGAALTTLYVSATQLSASVPAADVATWGTATVTVVDPAPGGGTSAAASFTTNPTNPAPTVASLAPASATAGTSAFNLTVAGTNFISTSSVYWNGTALPTSFVSSAQLTAQVSASFIASAGTATVTVVNPAPGGGTSGTAVFSINAANPTPALSSLSPTSATAGIAAFDLTVTGSGFIAASAVQWNGTPLPTTYGSATQLIAQVPATDLADAGAATVDVVNPAPGGGTSSAAIFAINPANPVPAISSLSPAAGTAGAAALSLTITGTGFIPGSSVAWNATPLPTTYVSAAQLIAQVPSADLASAGSAGISVFNPVPGGGTSGVATFTIDASNPVPTLAAISPMSTTAGATGPTLIVAGSGFVAAALVEWNGTALPTAYVSATQLSAQVTAADVANAGTGSVTVVNPTPGGGTSSVGTFTIDAANLVPVLSSITPTSATAGAAAFTLSVNGANFVPASTVDWAGGALTTTYVSDSVLTAEVPAAEVASSGSASVTVVNPAPGGGTSGTAAFAINSVNPVPSIGSLVPASTTAGSTDFGLTVNGSNFVTGSVVDWNGAPLPTSYVSATQLSASVPAADAASTGSASVAVINPAPGGGTSGTAVFSINAANPIPTLASLSPASATAGTAAFNLTVSGGSFIAASAVEWNGTALPTTYVSATQVIAQVSAADIADAGSATVNVANPAPGGGISSTAAFAINPANPVPTLSSLSPASAAAGSAAFALTVNGTGFIPISSVVWNGAPLPTAYVSATQLTAQVPAADVATAGPGTVGVVNPAPGGGTSGTAGFTVIPVNPTPVVDSLAPMNIAAGGGSFNLTVNGTGFVAGSAVQWNGAALPSSYVSATQVTAQVPQADIATPGSASISIVSPAPGGGTSNSADFFINSSNPAPTLVQYNTVQTSATAGENNATVQFNTMTAPGHAIWVAVTISDFAEVHSISVSDTQNNTYTLLNQENDGAPGSQSVAHFYAANIAGDTATPDTVTVTWSWDNYKGVLIAEVAGTTTAPLVGYNASIQDGLGAGTGNVAAGPVAVTAAQTPALILALSMNTSGGSSDTGGSGYGGPGAAPGFTQVTQCWNWGLNLATFETATVENPGSAAARFNAPDTDSYVTVEAVFQ
jgi:hypothetical protein